MTQPITRRQFLATSATTAALAGGAATGIPAGDAPAALVRKRRPPQAPLRLGLMTYNLGRDWDIDTIIANLTKARWEHAELRTTHAHGVEVTLSKAQRRTVRKRFEDAGIALSLASAFSYHWPDPAQVRKNIEATKQYTILAHDIGARGIRVFPNALLTDQGIPAEKTIEQIGKAVAECARFAADLGVEIRLANHGRGTNRLTVTRKILDAADCPHVFVNWNCDPTDIQDPGFEANFNSVKDRIGNIHLHDLTSETYPYRKLFALLRQNGYFGYCDAEVPPSKEPLVFMKYYRALFLALQNEL